MKITERSSGRITILDLQGRIAFGDGDDAFRAALSQLIDSGCSNLVINMAEVPFVDSAGLSQLVRAFVTTGRGGGQLKLLSPTRRVHELLTMTRLHTVIPVFDSEEEAVASFGEIATNSPSQP